MMRERECHSFHVACMLHNFSVYPVLSMFMKSNKVAL